MGRLQQTFKLRLQILINIFILLHVTPIIVKREFLIVKRSALNRIFSDSISFDRRCNDLERWLLEGDYQEKEVRKQVLRGRTICENDLLNRERTLSLSKKKKKIQLTFSLTYSPPFKYVRNFFEELHLLLTPDQAHKTVSSEIPIIGFKNAKSLKDHLVRAVSPQLDREGRFKPGEGANRSCEVSHTER